jgi:hypothetical protein
LGDVQNRGLRGSNSRGEDIENFGALYLLNLIRIQMNAVIGGSPYTIIWISLEFTLCGSRRYSQPPS